jgi:tRNA nucleotidyltransferase/poly(A) polymerase
MLDEQRRNLTNIESTAGSIRDLVDRLPPQHQEEAKQIVEQLRRALGDQGKLVNAYAEKSAESARQLQQHTELVEHGLSTLETNFGSLKAVPILLHDLSEQLRQHDQRNGAANDIEKTKLDAVKAAVDALAARPAPQCPPCVCDAARALDAGVRPH